MRFLLLGIFFLASSGGSLSGQSGELLDRTVGTDELTIAGAAALVAAAAGTVEPDETGGVVDLLRSLNYRVPVGETDEPITKGGLALLVAQLFDHRGGLRYELLATRVSAFRELQSLGYYTPWEFPGEHLTGAEALDLIHRFSMDSGR